MTFAEKMTKIMLYGKDEERPSGSGAKDDCYFCDDKSFFIVIGQRDGSDFGGYVERRTCRGADCISRAIAVVKKDTGL